MLRVMFFREPSRASTSLGTPGWNVVAVPTRWSSAENGAERLNLAVAMCVCCVFSRATGVPVPIAMGCFLLMIFYRAKDWLSMRFVENWWVFREKSFACRRRLLSTYMFPLRRVPVECTRPNCRCGTATSAVLLRFILAALSFKLLLLLMKLFRFHIPNPYLRGFGVLGG